MRTCCVAQGTLLNALWGSKWEGNQIRGDHQKQISITLGKIPLLAEDFRP